MGIKNWFYFSRLQRQGIIVLISIIIISPLTSRIMLYYKTTRQEEKVAFLVQAKELGDIMATMQNQHAGQVKAANQQVITPTPFNPNTLTPEGWKEMGVPDRIIRAIQNYINAGGVFRYKEDLKRIYVMTDAIYDQLANDIQLPERNSTEALHADDQTMISGQFARDSGASISAGIREESVSAPREIPLIDINEADSIDLQKLSGIGPVFGSRIVRYRDLLGGYYCTSQLLDVYGMDSIRFEHISPYIYVAENPHLRKIDLNSGSFADLIRHPYLDRGMVQAILQLRRETGAFSTIEKVKQSHIITNTDWEKISPYLKADDPESFD